MRGFIVLLLTHFSIVSFAVVSDSIATSEVDLKPEPAIAVWDINDSLYHIPSFDLYCGFDKKKIWGVKA